MCNPTNLDKNNMAAAINGNSLRRIHRRSPTTVIAATGLCVSTVEETTQRTMLAESETFTATLNDIDCEPSAQKRRRAHQGSRRPRPDARGRIGNKECHIFAFVEQFDEMARRPDVTGRIGNKECHAFAFIEEIEDEI